jgi:hypothetical protein
MKKLIGLVVLILGLAANAGAQCTITSNMTSGFVGVSGYGLVDKSVVTQTDGFGISLDNAGQLLAEYGLASHRIPNGDTADHSIYGAVIKMDGTLDGGAGGFEYDTWASAGFTAGTTYRQFGLVNTSNGLMLQMNTWYPHYYGHHTPPLYWIYSQLYNQPYTVGVSPKYLRLIRSGAYLEADTSPDGVNWTQVVLTTVGSGAINENIGVFTYGQQNHGNVHVLQLENVNIDGAGTAINYDEQFMSDGSLNPYREFVGGAIQEVQAGGTVGLLANPVGVGNQQSWIELTGTCNPSTFDSSLMITDNFAATGGGGTVFPNLSACVGLSKCYISYSNPLNYPNGGEYIIQVLSSGLFNIEHSVYVTGDNGFATTFIIDQKFDITVKTQ